MKKVLIITYYWPPAGGPGVQRWLKFVKYLREFAIEPVVYIPENPNYPILDEAIVQEIPKGIKIYKHPIIEPYTLARFLSRKKTKQISSGLIQAENQSLLEKVMLWIRGNLFIPDARKYWIAPSVTFLSTVLKQENITSIITTGPPHSVHLIGYHLKEKFNLKWIADFRDPWTSIGYHKKLRLTKASQKKHKTLEQLVLNGADKILVTSASTKREFEGITNTPISVITNGYDGTYTETKLTSKFTMAHIGSLLTGRNPQILWKVLSELVQENHDFKEALELQFVGVVSADVLAAIYGYHLAPFVTVMGYVSHDKALQVQRASQVLLLIEINASETKGILPGKMFEYMAAKRPILAIGPKKWDAAAIIAETAAGETFNYTQESDLKALILKWFIAYQKNELSVSSSHIHQYSRRELTKKLAAEL